MKLWLTPEGFTRRGDPEHGDVEMEKGPPGTLWNGTAWVIDTRAQIALIDAEVDIIYEKVIGKRQAEYETAEKEALACREVNYEEIAPPPTEAPTEPPPTEPPAPTEEPDPTEEPPPTEEPTEPPEPTEAPAPTPAPAPTQVTPSAYPTVASWAFAKGWTMRQAADNIITVSTQWRLAQNAIRAQRLLRKEQLRLATTNEQVIAIMNGWNQFLAYIKTQLGVT